MNMLAHSKQIRFSIKPPHEDITITFSYIHFKMYILDLHILKLITKN